MPFTSASTSTSPISPQQKRERLLHKPAHMDYILHRHRGRHSLKPTDNIHKICDCQSTALAHYVEFLFEYCQLVSFESLQAFSNTYIPFIHTNLQYQSLINKKPLGQVNNEEAEMRNKISRRPASMNRCIDPKRTFDQNGSHYAVTNKQRSCL